MIELFEEAGQQMSMLPRTVQNWMLWLNIIFFSGLLFVLQHAEPRWAIAAHVACFPVGFTAYHFTRNLDLMGLSHILFWTPLLFYLPKVALQNSDFHLISPYGIWMSLLCLTIVISLVFDVRAAIVFFTSSGLRER